MTFVHKGLAMLLVALATTAAQAACYTIYNAKNEVIYRDTTPPMDMSPSLSDTLPSIAPAGSQLVFSPDSHICSSRVDELNTVGRDLSNANSVTEGINLPSLISSP